jgi:2-oxoglutarate ferredoxin oxidoreductase subunit alpha
MLGNEACGAGAIAAGVRFFAGYPITPSTEIAEYMARELPKVGGKFIQMEDEIASMGALMGASVAGGKAMTATSAMGFSLMQEFIGYSSALEIPCLIVNIMRGGPSGGGATQPAQADVMQARWGPHGDHPVIVLSCSTVPEMYHLTIKAVNFSEKYRIPVILLSDESIGHLRETTEIPAEGSLEIVNRAKPDVPPDKFVPLKAEMGQAPPMACMGEGYGVKGYYRLPRNQQGDPQSSPAVQDALMRRLESKISGNLAEIQIFKDLGASDADVVVFAHGSNVRTAVRACSLAKQKGVKAGVFKANTLFPFPYTQVGEATRKAKAVLVPELNAGQIIGEVDRACRGRAPVVGLTKVDGTLITVNAILDSIMELSKS